VPVQSTAFGAHIWRPASHADPTSYPTWLFDERCLSDKSSNVACAISVTHSIVNDVAAYTDQSLPHVGRIISCVVLPGPSPSAILDSTHAKLLSQQLSTYLKGERTSEEKQATLHLFVAAPNGLLFFLGQLARSFGRCQLYEYEFESGTPGAYTPSLLFPPGTWQTPLVNLTTNKKV